jgi:putative FmdB family regulatory protein
MPTYEYECNKCKSQFEIKRGFHEEGGGCCPRCGGEGRQIFSPTPIIFKGSGFYVTDHRKKDDNATDREPPVKPEAEKPAKKDDTVKAETKPSTDKPSPKTESGKPPPKPEPNK